MLSLNQILIDQMNVKKTKNQTVDSVIVHLQFVLGSEMNGYVT